MISSLQNGARARSATRAFVGLCDKVIDETMSAERAADKATHPGEFGAADSARLVLNAPRVGGFLRAIGRAPQAGSVIDAGCGASALLSLGAAVSHDRAKVVAYEINGHAARCASRVVELFGLDDRITVVNDDVLTARLPAADLAVTETFSPALLAERGTLITATLAERAREILPAHVVINACDVPVTDQRRAPWMRAAGVDLSRPSERINGQLTSTGPGERPVIVQASYYDAGHQAVLDYREVDSLTYPVELGRVGVQAAGATIGFSYMPGTELTQSPAAFWVG